MENRKDEQLIYIKDLMFTVFYRWKIVLTVALILALLLGGLQMLPAIMGRGSLSQEDAQQISVYETEKAAMDQRIKTLQKAIADREAYLGNSLRMQLDPYNHYEAQLTISARILGIEPGLGAAFDAHAVLEAYKGVLAEEVCLTQMAEILQIPAQYVSELMSVDLSDLGTETLTVTVKCADSTAAAALAETVNMQLQQYSAQIAVDVAPHNLSVLKSTVLAQADTLLAEDQRAEIGWLAELLISMSDAQTKRSSLVVPDALRAVSIRAALKKAALFAAIGAFLGLFLTVCILWVAHIVRSKVYSCRSLHNRTGVKILGAVDSGKKRRPLQRWLRKLEGRAVSAKPALVATDIALRFGEKKLLVTGTASEQSRKELAEALRKVMPDAVITEAACVLEDPDSLESLAACEAVVLLEQCDLSLYHETQQQLDKFSDYDKPLIGCVVVDG